MLKFKKFFTAFISLLSLIAFSISISAYSLELNKARDIFINSKISPVLFEKMNHADENELIPIYLFRKNETYDYVNESICYESSEYESEYSGVSNEKEITKAYENLLDFRKRVKEINRSNNTSFVEKNIPPERKIYYLSEYTPTIIVDATLSEIKEYILLDDVTDVDYFEEYVEVPDTHIALSQTNANVISGSHYNSGNGYTGSEIRIGVIEANSGRYDSESPHLCDISSDHLSYVTNYDSDGNAITPTVSPHATKVVSLIIGQDVEVNNKVYRGVAQDAKVFQTSVVNSSDFYRAFEMLTSDPYNVDIINYSGGATTSGYASYDRQADYLIQYTKTTLVKSAGNTSDEVSSPGKALNAITVGNAQTKTGGNTEAEMPYSMYSTSSYSEPSYLPNKPDISAPGTKIRTAVLSNSNDTPPAGTGTSYAAPIVTGIIAQAKQRYQSLIGNPYTTKAYILNCVNYSCMSTSSNPISGNNYLRNKSGAGLIDALVIPISQLKRSGTVKRLSNVVSSQEYEYTQGTRVRVTLVFGRSVYSDEVEVNDVVTTFGKTGPITELADLDNLDLQIVNSNGNVVAYSRSTVNNVEIIEFEIPETGNYRYQCTATTIKDTTHGVPYGMSWIVLPD